MYPPIFIKKWRARGAAAKIARAINELNEFANNFRGDGINIMPNELGGLDLSFDRVLLNFSGDAYDPAGNKTTGLTDATKPWVKYDLSSGQITEETGPPSEPWGANETWRKKSDFTGSIYF